MQIVFVLVPYSVMLTCAVKVASVGEMVRRDRGPGGGGAAGRGADHAREPAGAHGRFGGAGVLAGNHSR